MCTKSWTERFACGDSISRNCVFVVEVDVAMVAGCRFSVLCFQGWPAVSFGQFVVSAAQTDDAMAPDTDERFQSGGHFGQNSRDQMHWSDCGRHQQNFLHIVSCNAVNFEQSRGIRNLPGSVRHPTAWILHRPLLASRFHLCVSLRAPQKGLQIGRKSLVAIKRHVVPPHAPLSHRISARDKSTIDPH